MKKPKPRSYEVRVPGSSANLGTGFDCFGLALNLFLTVRATVHSEPGARSEARSRGIPGSRWRHARVRHSGRPDNSNKRASAQRSGSLGAL